MMGWLGGVVMVAALGAAPVSDGAAGSRMDSEQTQQQQVAQAELDEALAAAMSYPSSVCTKKRVDACGCHHVYGTRHCHPDRKGKHCEAVVKADAPWLQPLAALTP